jgi:long-chain fatty acid transport protein
MGDFRNTPYAPVLGLALLLATNGQAQGAGFQITEQSVTGLGRAFAGGSIAADDASAIVYNPADMMLVTDQDNGKAHIGVTVIKLRADFRAKGTSTLSLPIPPALGGGRFSRPIDGDRREDGGGGVPVPTLGIITKVTDNLALGFGANALFGLETDYNLGWVGRYVAAKSELLTIDLNPSAAYRFNEHFSIGGGFSAVYADTQLTQASPPTDPAELLPSPTLGPENDGRIKLDGDTWGYGFNLGATYELDETARIGLSFRSKVELDFDDGDLTITSPRTGRVKVGGKAKIDLPEQVWLEGFKRFDKWAVMGHLRWTKWDRLDELVVRSEEAARDLGLGSDVLQKVPFNWDNVWMVGLGLNYYYNAAWIFRAGAAYDQAPTPNARLRNPRVPDTDRYWLSIGASLRPPTVPGLSIDFGWSHLFTDDADIDYTLEVINGTGVETNLRGELKGEDGQDLVGLQVSYTF